MNLYRIYINDSGNRKGYDALPEYWSNMDTWARNHCASYQGHDIQDVSDVSLQWDEITEFRFADEKDAMLFELRWG